MAWAFSPERLENIFSDLDEYREKYHPGKPIRKSIGFWTNVFETPDEMEAALKERAKQRNMSLERVREQVSSALWGTPEEICEKQIGYTWKYLNDAMKRNIAK